MLASFALEKDYHLVLKDKLAKIKKYILSMIDAQIEYFVDNGPVDEKLAAYLSGLGYYGKNTLIINKDFGSYILIGELLVDFEIVSSIPVTNNCANCDLCDQHCPTDATKAVYDKCLAGFLQRKISLSDEIYNQFTKIYGCDVCISICPKNSRVKTKENYLYENVDLLDIIKSTRHEFTRYNEYAFYWLGHNLMKRNAIIIAANNGIDITKELDYVNSTEDYMLSAIKYYKKKMNI